MDDLTLQLERLADEGTPRGASTVMHAARQSLLIEPREVPRAKTEWRARRMLLVAGVVVLVAVVAASVMVATRGAHQPSTILPAISDATSYRDLYDTSDQPLDGPMHLVPGSVPDGLSLVRVDDPWLGGGSRSIQQWDRILGFVRLDAAGERAQDWFRVSWGSGLITMGPDLGATSTTAGGDPLAAYRSQGTPVTVHGHDGLAVDDPTTQLVIWEESPGRVVQVDSSSLSTDDLAAIADGVVAGSDGGFDVTRAPEGFVQVSSEPSDVAPGAGRDVIFAGANGRGFGVFIEDHSERSPGSNLLVTGGPFGDRRIVDVNGRHAVLGSQMDGGIVFNQQTQFLAEGDRTVQWLEPGNTRVMLVTVGLSEDEVLAVARGLRTVDASEWQQLHVTTPGPTDTAPPVTAAPSTPEPEFTGEEAAIADVFHRWVSRPDVDSTVAILEDGEALRDTIEQVRTRNPGSDNHSARVDAVQLVDDTHASVTFSILTGGSLTLANQNGTAVKIDGTWHVSRATYCATVGMGVVQCPPG
jgi:hypothetical protein